METITSEEASADAVHKAKSAAQAVEMAREAQLSELVEQTAQKTKQALLEGLKEVFGDGDEKNPAQMKILIRRIPIICTQIDKIHTDIAWTSKVVTAGVFLLVPVFGWLALTTISNSNQLSAVAATLSSLTK